MYNNNESPRADQNNDQTRHADAQGAPVPGRAQWRMQRRPSEDAAQKGAQDHRAVSPTQQHRACQRQHAALPARPAAAAAAAGRQGEFSQYRASSASPAGCISSSRLYVKSRRYGRHHATPRNDALPRAERERQECVAGQPRSTRAQHPASGGGGASRSISAPR